jgi:hypothetical protein
MSNVHQDFKAGLDTKGYEAGMHRIENATKTSTARVTREFEKVQQSVSRGGMGSMRAGQVAMQMQDVAVQMQSGARASTIIAQQGSQILSVFGPQGMLLGGLIAAGAMFWELVRGSKALTSEAKAQKAIERQGRSTSAAQSGLEEMRADQKAVKIAEARATLSKEEADQVERRLNFEERIAKIRSSQATPENKAVFEGAATERFNAEERAIFKQRQRKNNERDVQALGDKVNDRAAQIRGETASKSDARRQGREEIRSQRRAASELVDRMDRDARNERPRDAHRGDGSMMKDNRRNIGLTKEEREAAREKAMTSAAAAKKGKIMAEFSDDQIQKIVTGLDKLIAT